MAGSFSDYAEAKILEHVVGKTSFTMPATVAVALVTVTPTDAMTGATITEATYTGYARKTTAGADWEAAASPGGTIQNANAITFAACTGSTSTVIGVVVLDNSTTGAGNSLFYSDVASKVIDVSNTPATLAAGAFDLSLS